MIAGAGGQSLVKRFRVYCAGQLIACKLLVLLKAVLPAPAAHCCCSCAQGFLLISGPAKMEIDSGTTDQNDGN
jgi:hypothetical protein